MLNIILGFLPWVLYFILLGYNQYILAISTALVVTVLLSFNELKKGFILTWGTFLFFLLLLGVTLFTSLDWLTLHADLIASYALASIAGFSLLIDKPFTLQYAREQVPKEFWESKIFVRINQWITGVWTASFLINACIDSLQLYTAFNPWFYQTISYLPMVFAVWFTQKFPDWYKEKKSCQLIEQSELAQKNNPFLQHNFAPITQELEVSNLSVTGLLPKDLLGIYVRNGPNPLFPPFSYTYPFDGDGMLHALYFKEGQVTYKNRFVNTTQLQVERRFGKAIYGGVELPFIRDAKLLKPTDPSMPVKIGRFIHVIRHADRYLALHEATSAYEIDAQLNTLGEWNPSNAAEAIALNAHTRLDPQTGELFTIAYGSESIITYHVFNKKGKLTKQGIINVQHNYMVHDFVITHHYVVIFLCPVIVDFMAKMKGKHFATWEPQFPTRIAVLSRAHLDQEIIWINSEAFFCFHFANAYEDKQEIIVDYVRYPDFMMATADLKPAFLYRTTLNLLQKTAHHQQLDDRNVEFPRINDHYTGNQHRYIYTPACFDSASASSDIYHALIKYDLNTNSSIVHDFGQDIEIGEAVYVPANQAKQEDEGYLMLFTYHKTTKESLFVILDAQNFAASPLAIIKLPQRVPHGLHGSWFPGSW
ncbi:TPA: carotenoid oxygenase family protein [Legionella pneumophila]